jgi:phenol 2-monooxygenase
MQKSPSRLVPDYALEVTGLEIDRAQERPVRVTLRKTSSPGAAEELTVRARYVVGCDGAHSTVRRSIGRPLHGDSANQEWGVMDVLAITDFPDIRYKSVIQSADGGNIVIIPREGGYLVRLYIELGELAPGQRVSTESTSVNTLIEAAQQILHPYRLDVQEVVWWSVYEIGQRLTDKFDDVTEADEHDPRVFIAGDACHTHSPKAGQGMNVSMQDAFNLGWKLAAVLEGRADPSLLSTYSSERQTIAQGLIDFDREWSAMISAKPLASTDSGEEGVDPSELQQYFAAQGRYTAGVATRYEPSPITGRPLHQGLASGFPIGERFHSAPVIRLADAKPMQLGHVARADGRWRLYLFADHRSPDAPDSGLRALCDFLEGSDLSPIRRFTPEGADIDSVFDVRAVFQQAHPDPELARLPRLLLPQKGRYGLHDYEKCFAPDPDQDVFDLRGIDRKEGCLVIVRPDQYVSHVLPLDGYEQLTGFFSAFMVGSAVPAEIVHD